MPIIIMVQQWSRRGKTTMVIIFEGEKNKKQKQIIYNIYMYVLIVMFLTHRSTYSTIKPIFRLQSLTP